MAYDEDVLSKYLGSGIKYPSMFSSATGSTKIVEGRDKIRQSIRDILETRIGERIDNPEYGTRLYKVLFEPNDHILKDLASYYTKEDIERWEDRVNVHKVQVETKRDDESLGEHDISLTVIYSIDKTNLQDSFSTTIRGERLL